MLKYIHMWVAAGIASVAVPWWQFSTSLYGIYLQSNNPIMFPTHVAWMIKNFPSPRVLMSSCTLTFSNWLLFYVVNKNWFPAQGIVPFPGIVAMSVSTYNYHYSRSTHLLSVCMAFKCWPVLCAYSAPIHCMLWTILHMYVVFLLVCYKHQWLVIGNVSALFDLWLCC